MSSTFFAARKTAEALATPLALVCWALLGGWLLQRSPRERRQRWGRRLVTVALIGLLALSYGIPFDFIGTWLEDRYAPLTDTRALAGTSLIHVLGGDITDRDGLPPSNALGPQSNFRAAEGVRLYGAIPGSRLLFTGYGEHAEHTSASAGAQFAAAMGVPAAAIVMDSVPHTTAEEVVTAKRLAGDRPMILVTSALHMPRAMRLFQRGGLHPVPAPTGYHAMLHRDSLRDWIAPSADRVAFAGAVLHELLGILLLTITG